MKFSIESFFNPHLPLGGKRLDAVLTVTSSGEEMGTVSGGQKAVAFIADVSGSMSGEKIQATKLAIRRCIDLLSEDTLFTVIAFANNAKALFPMTRATREAKDQAHQLVQHLSANGGTEMSKALMAAKAEFERFPGAIACAMFLTDGQNNSDDSRPLKSAIAACKDAFQCDCRGVGTDWDPRDLKTIANALLGNADAVSNPEGLEADFRDFLGRALSKGVSGAKLRLWSPKSARLLSVKQMSPEIVDLLALAQRVDDKTLDIPLGAWGVESRDYHVAIELEAAAEGEEMLACRPSVVLIENGVEVKSAGQPVVATWTADEALSTRINGQVAHYTGQEELAASIKEGLEAKARGDVDQATKLLGKAAKIADASGNDEVTRRLAKVVDVVDASTGTVRLKAGNNKAADLELDMGGTRTVRRRTPTSTNA